MLNGQRAGAVFVCGVLVVVARVHIHASGNLQRVTHAVLVGVGEASSVAVVVLGGQRAGAVFVRGVLVVVARVHVRASGNFQRVTHAVLVDVRQTIAFTIQM